MIDAPNKATESTSQVAARLDRLPFSRTLRRLVFLLALGGAFEFYDLFLSPYVAPGPCLRRKCLSSSTDCIGVIFGLMRSVSLFRRAMNSSTLALCTAS